MPSAKTAPNIPAHLQEAPAAAPAPKMGMEHMPAEVTEKMAPPAAAAAPKFAGMVAPPAKMFTLPDIQQKHYYEVFPALSPQPAGPESPGVFLNPDGTIYQPRERRGGQFAALYITIANKFKPAMQRNVLVPLNTLPDTGYGAKPYEKVVERTEVLFDFEEDLHECMEAFGIDAKIDPLKARMREKGLGDAYDNTSTTPGLY